MSASQASLQCSLPQQADNAFESLYNNHHGWLHGWIFKRLNCNEQAADLAQDTFVRVLQQRKAAELREPKAYLSTVARSLMIDGIRRRSLEQAYFQALALQPEPVEVSVETRAIIIDSLMRLDTLLDGMEQRTRTIFLMAQLDGLSYVEIGRRLEVSVNTVRKHFTRALTHCLLVMQE